MLTYKSENISIFFEAFKDIFLLHIFFKRYPIIPNALEKNKRTNKEMLQKYTMISVVEQ